MRCYICDASLDSPSNYHDSLSQHYEYPYGRVPVKRDKAMNMYICEQCESSYQEALAEFEDEEDKLE